MRQYLIMLSVVILHSSQAAIVKLHTSHCTRHTGPSDSCKFLNGEPLPSELKTVGYYILVFIENHAGYVGTCVYDCVHQVWIFFKQCFLL